MFIEWFGSLATVAILMSISFAAGMIYRDERSGK